MQAPRLSLILVLTSMFDVQGSDKTKQHEKRNESTHRGSVPISSPPLVRASLVFVPTKESRRNVAHLLTATYKGKI